MIVFDHIFIIYHKNVFSKGESVLQYLFSENPYYNFYTSQNNTFLNTIFLRIVYVLIFDLSDAKLFQIPFLFFL